MQVLGARAQRVVVVGADGVERGGEGGFGFRGARAVWVWVGLIVVVGLVVGWEVFGMVVGLVGGGGRHCYSGLVV